jgi:hypothetical protein
MTPHAKDVDRLAPLGAKAASKRPWTTATYTSPGPATSEAERDGTAMRSKITLVGLTAVEPRLEDIFFEVIEGQGP